VGAAGGDGRVTGLAGVLVWTSADRHPAMAAFYRDVLGLQPRRDRPGFFSAEWGAARLTVTVHDRVDGPSRDPLRIMLNLAVDDVHAVHDRLRSAGVPIRRAPELEEWGGWVCTFEDPDGNLVQLFELPREDAPSS
jgi:catechol 2,3-dioxygenase-like lactoylglutathione lyase family enzyme